MIRKTSTSRAIEQTKQGRPGDPEAGPNFCPRPEQLLWRGYFGALLQEHVATSSLAMKPPSGQTEGETVSHKILIEQSLLQEVSQKENRNTFPENSSGVSEPSQLTEVLGRRTALALRSRMTEGCHIQPEVHYFQVVVQPSVVLQDLQVL